MPPATLQSESDSIASLNEEEFYQFLRDNKELAKRALHTKNPLMVYATFDSKGMLDNLATTVDPEIQYYIEITLCQQRDKPFLTFAEFINYKKTIRSLVKKKAQLSRSVWKVRKPEERKMGTLSLSLSLSPCHPLSSQYLSLPPLYPYLPPFRFLKCVQRIQVGAWSGLRRFQGDGATEQLGLDQSYERRETMAPIPLAQGDRFTPGTLGKKNKNKNKNKKNKTREGEREGEENSAEGKKKRNMKQKEKQVAALLHYSVV